MYTVQINEQTKILKRLIHRRIKTNNVCDFLEIQKAPNEEIKKGSVTTVKLQLFKFFPNFLSFSLKRGVIIKEAQEDSQ